MKHALTPTLIFLLHALPLALITTSPAYGDKCYEAERKVDQLRNSIAEQHKEMKEALARYESYAKTRDQQKRQALAEMANILDSVKDGACDAAKQKYWAAGKNFSDALVGLALGVLPAASGVDLAPFAADTYDRAAKKSKELAKELGKYERRLQACCNAKKRAEEEANQPKPLPPIFGDAELDGKRAHDELRRRPKSELKRIRELAAARSLPGCTEENRLLILEIIRIDGSFDPSKTKK